MISMKEYNLYVFIRDSLRSQCVLYYNNCVLIRELKGLEVDLERLALQGKLARQVLRERLDLLDRRERLGPMEALGNLAHKEMLVLQ